MALSKPRSGSSPAIDAVVPTARDPHLRRIKVAGRTVSTLPLDIVEALDIRPGRRWTPALARSAAQAAAHASAHEHAMRLLGRQAMASSRLEERLERAGHAAELAAQVVRELTASGWIDDGAFAETVAAAILRRGPAGRRLLSSRLRARGVPPEMADDVAGRLASDGLDAVTAQASALVRRQRGTPPQVARRVAAALARRGIDDDTIRSALSRLGLPPGDETP